MGMISDGRRRARDKNGWRIPQRGTLRRKIYDLAVTGMSTRDIRIALKLPSAKARYAVWAIKNPEAQNAQENSWRHSLSDSDRLKMYRSWMRKSRPQLIAAE